MTQNTEQNVRTRDEQAQWMGRCIKASGDRPSLEGFLREHIRIAEARGAAEERAKAVEIAGYLSPELASVLRQKFPGAAVTLSAHKTHTRYIPVYYTPANVAGIDVDAVIRNVSELPDRTSPDDQPDLLMVTADELRLIISEAQPANVAALEARVKALEADAARFVWVTENTGCFWYGLPGFGPEHGRSYENRMKDLRSAIDRNMAGAALTREGGV